MSPDESPNTEQQLNPETVQKNDVDSLLLNIQSQEIQLEMAVTTPEYSALVTDRLHSLGYDDEDSTPEEVVYAGRSLLGYETHPEGKSLTQLREEFPALAEIEQELLQHTDLSQIREKAEALTTEKKEAVERLKKEIPKEVHKIISHLDYKKILDQEYFTRQNETITPNMLLRWHLKYLHRISNDANEDLSIEDSYTQLRRDWQDLKMLQEKPDANATELNEDQLFARSLGEEQRMPSVEEIEKAKTEIRSSKNTGSWIRAYQESALVTGNFDQTITYENSSILENIDELVAGDGQIEDFATENPYFLVAAADKMREEKDKLLKNGIEVDTFTTVTPEQIEEAERLFADIPALIHEVQLTNAINDWRGPSMEKREDVVDIPLPRELLAISLSVKDGKLSDKYADQPELTVLVAQRVKKLREDLVAQGVPETRTGIPTPEEVQSAKEILLSTHETAQEIQDYSELSRKYKGSGVAMFMALTNMDACRLNMSVHLYLKESNGIPDRLQDQDVFLVALAKEVQKERVELQRKGLLKRGENGVPQEDIGVSSSFDASISGIGDKEGQFCVISEKSITDYYTRTDVFGVVPKHFTAHLTDLSFTSAVDGLKSIDEIKREEVDAISEQMRRQLSNTLVHEMFEGVVLNLSHDELKKWDDVVKAEPQSVTMYERMLILNGYEELARKESLCESGAMFTTNPYALWLVSQKRFEYMLDLKCSYLPEEMRGNVREKYVSEMQMIDEQVAENKRALRKTLTRHEKVNKKQLKVLEQDGTSVMGEYKLKNMDPVTGKITGGIEINYSPYIPLSKIK